MPRPVVEIKSTKNIFGAKFKPKVPKLVPKLGFLPFSSLVLLFYVNLHTVIACINVLGTKGTKINVLNVGMGDVRPK